MVPIFPKNAAIFLLWTNWLVQSTCVSGTKNITYSAARHIRSLGFPDGSGMGIFFALGVPVDIPNKSVQFSIYFEANYGLPGEWNSSYYGEDIFLKKRSLDRRMAYDILLNKLTAFGYPGEICLAKMICEISKEPFIADGLFESVLHILLTPSSSQGEDLPKYIIEAEYVDDCEKTYQECKKTPLTLLSHYVRQNSF